MPIKKSPFKLTLLGEILERPPEEIKSITETQDVSSPLYDVLDATVGKHIDSSIKRVLEVGRYGDTLDVTIETMINRLGESKAEEFAKFLMRSGKDLPRMMGSASLSKIMSSASAIGAALHSEPANAPDLPPELIKEREAKRRKK